MGLLLSMILVLIPSEYCFMETQPGSLNARGVDIPPTSSFFGHRVELLIFMRAEHKVYKDVSGRSVLYDLKYGATACRGCPLCQIARSAAQQMKLPGFRGVPKSSRETRPHCSTRALATCQKHCDALLVKVGLERSAALPNRDNRRRSGNQWGGRARICCSRGSTPKCDAVLHQQPAAQLGVVERLDAPDAQAQRAQEGVGEARKLA
ncbi:hypothetical protein BGZ60DRAFT_426424 [Tricladium varicosporioides]|nr:hypothetical protein BGZ60DRAFT_426424 [Hymenoscyphus varicosporioides]